MRLALIPPRGLGQRALKGTALMSLSIPAYHGSFEWASVVRASKNSRKGTFYHILDNGAAEGEPCDAATLVSYAKALEVNEVVSPDIMGDYEGTMMVNQKFFNDPPTGFAKFKWMGVIQGDTEDDLVRCASFYAQNPAISTLGIPRITIQKLNKLNARIDLANRLSTQFGDRFQLHLLGGHPAWPGEIRAAAQYTTVRSMDTSLPFNYALAGKYIVDNLEPVSRPKGYFTSFQEPNPQILEFNLYAAMEWANGRSVGKPSQATPASQV
jgi:hypothetical protein